MDSISKRRLFLKSGVSTVGTLLLAQNFGSKAFASACGITPPQTPGPFYPGKEEFHPESDLTLIPGNIDRAAGQIIYIAGKVVDKNCKPIEGAAVEIWQACHTGKYNNPKDDNPEVLDPNFKYWGEVFTDSTGSYRFKTIRPGAYPADTHWTRPPHIHFKVSRRGYHELITQLYFKGDPLNDLDLILQGIPAATRNSVIVAFQPSSPVEDAGSLTGIFDITLQSVR